MPTTSTRTIGLGFTGDVNAPNMNYEAANNSSSPGEIELVDLSTSPLTVTPPSGFAAVTILPPAENDVLITLKGVSGDTGVKLHMTDPTSIGLDSTLTTFVLV